MKNKPKVYIKIISYCMGFVFIGALCNLKTTSLTFAAELTGDINGDGVVSVADLAIMASNWGMTSGATWSMGDLNNDGAVGIDDLAILAVHWGDTLSELPSVPSGLSASPSSGTNVNLSWDTASGATGYIVYRDGAQITATTNQTYGDGGLASGQTFAYTIAASNGYGVSDETGPDYATPPGSSFMTASGNNLMLAGNTFQFIGFDAYGMTGCFNGTAWTTQQLDSYFSNLPSNGVTRIWAFQYYGTTAIAKILTEAAKYNQRVILVLGNDDGNCDPNPTDPNQTGEPLSFYQSGWEGSYTDWVNTLVPMFAGNTSIAMWEIANEPGQAVSVPESTMETYLSGAAALIKSDDTNHLVESGVNDDANMGGGESNYQAAQSSSNINVLSFHDYAWDFENQAVESGNFTVAQEAAVALNKPFIAGEAGVESGPTCTNDLTEAQRVTYLQTKANDYYIGEAPNQTTGPAISGIMFWEYEPANTYGWSNGECIYDIFPGDPLISAIQNYVIP